MEASDALSEIQLLSVALDGKGSRRCAGGLIGDDIADQGSLRGPGHGVPHDHQGIQFQTHRRLDSRNVLELTSGAIVLDSMLMGMPNAFRNESADGKEDHQAECS